MRKWEIDERMMDFEIEAPSLRPLLHKETVDRLAIIGKARSNRREPAYMWIMMDSGAANHVCDPSKHFLAYRTHTEGRAGKNFVTATRQIIPNLGEKKG